MRHARTLKLEHNAGITIAVGPVAVEDFTWRAVFLIRAAHKWHRDDTFGIGVVTPFPEEILEPSEQPSVSLHTESLEADRC